MSRIRAFNLTDPVYDAPTVLVANCTGEEVLKWMSRRWPGTADGREPYGPETLGCVYTTENKETGDSQRVVWLQTFDGCADCLGVLTHELVHLVVRVLDRKSVPIERGYDEAAAYLYEFYFKKAYQFLSVAYSKKPRH